MASDADRTRPRIGTGWLVTAVVVLALVAVIVVVYATYTNQRDHTPSGGQPAATLVLRL